MRLLDIAPLKHLINFNSFIIVFTGRFVQAFMLQHPAYTFTTLQK